MGHEWQHVDSHFAFEVIQIFAKSVPAPIFVVDIFVEHATEILHQHLARLGFRRHRRAGSATVADHDARHTVVHHRIAVGILNHERIHVGVGIDEPRRHYVALGVDLFFAGSYVFADGGNFSAVDRQVSRECRAARAIDDRSVLDHYIVSHNRDLLPQSRQFAFLSHRNGEAVNGAGQFRV